MHSAARWHVWLLAHARHGLPLRAFVLLHACAGANWLCKQRDAFSVPASIIASMSALQHAAVWVHQHPAWLHVRSCKDAEEHLQHSPHIRHLHEGPLEVDLQYLLWYLLVCAQARQFTAGTAQAPLWELSLYHSLTITARHLLCYVCL